jgi:hypothetical protein
VLSINFVLRARCYIELAEMKVLLNPALRKHFSVGGNPPTIEKQLSFVANGKFSKLAVFLVKTGLSNGVLEPLVQSS